MEGPLLDAGIANIGGSSGGGDNISSPESDTSTPLHIQSQLVSGHMDISR